MIEGVNWYALQHPFKNDVIFVYGYSIIAFVFWPILIPFSAMVAEQRELWRRVWLLWIGLRVALSAYLWGKLVLSDGIDVNVVNHSLAYKPLFADPPAAIIAATLSILGICYIQRTMRINQLNIYEHLTFRFAQARIDKHQRKPFSPLLHYVDAVELE